jgi:predicted CoA-binding protein
MYAVCGNASGNKIEILLCNSNLLSVIVLLLNYNASIKSMKKLLLSFSILVMANVQAQSPQLNIKGADSVQVRMNKMFVKVNVVGNIAYTTAEMHFTNSGSRQMEAELLFPLPEGVSVSRYAIDINGEMREAVPVNKSKGKQVFEAIEHKRVDPGLLEKVEGNNFKTRIYPIVTGKERIIIIGYEQELSGFDKKNLAYQLVSRYPKKLDEFELVINVTGSASKPSVEEESGSVSSFEKSEDTPWRKSFTASVKKKNYKPSEKMWIKIPIREEIPSVLVQSVQGQHYFYGNTMVESNRIEKKAPASIGLVWDNSLSCKNRDAKKELQLLDGYFKQLKNVQVTLYLLNYNFEKGKTYAVSNGDWAELKTQLEQTQYDGGTRYSKVDLTGQDEYLFFTDGLSSLSENMLDKTKKPVYAVTSLPSADYAFLNYTALKSGADFINLNELDVAKALDKLVYRNFKFLGIKENYTVTDVYPMAGTTVSGSFSFSGISLKEKNEVVLLFGYNDKPASEIKIVLDAKAQQATEVNIEKLWAQKKIANLEIQYKKNAEEIETVGKKYGIVTRNTSLIVLEDINDYIQYDIVPPAALRAEFDKIQKQHQENRLAQKKNNWENVGEYHEELENWWKSDIKYTKPKGKKKKEAEKDQKGDEDARVTNDQPTGSSEYEIVTVDDNGNVTVEETSPGREQMNQSEGVARRRSVVSSSTSVVTTEEIKDKQISAAEVDEVKFVRPRVVEAAPQRDGDLNTNNPEAVRALAGKVSGVKIGNSTTYNYSVTDSTSNRTSNWYLSNENVKTNEWNPDRVYLKALEAAPADKQYALYLQLREEQFNNPAFYLDVANFFYNKGDKQRGLLVLSNIADLGLENHQLYKSLTYQLRQWEAYEEALYTANQVVKWRGHEPQSHRDLALVLEDNKQYQAAFDELVKALESDYFANMGGQYEGVEDIVLMDINRMVAEHPGIKIGELDKKYLKPMPVAVRIILNWNQMDTDIDLHVIEPTGEECYYSHTETEIGGRFSKDFTQGYGPEQYLLRNPLKGKYLISTNYYGESAITENGPATVMVEIYITKNGVTERKLQTIQLGTVKENQNLAELLLN